ncbi:MAG TPA: hypothetical protein DEF79_09205 [Gammaproteobacteria bacterium]|nr:hypothetical protein [Gammaproteobacteria bacterium]|tara:strand:- start:1861 stop:2997 length:1137 start_codon:yes stop_codon:yes gene_type:complete
MKDSVAITGKVRSAKALTFICGLVLTGITSAQNLVSDLSEGRFLDTPETTKFAVIMTGPAVGDDNAERFRQWSLSLHDILARDYGYSSGNITLLYDDGDGNFIGGERVDGACSREGIEVALERLAELVKTGDQITLYLIGHGSGAAEEAKFNIVGPDMTGVEFSSLLDRFDQQDMVIINTTSASFGFSSSLSSEGRVVISSTRSSSERFDPVFSRYFIEALDERNGDRDKNNRVSMLEAFEYARANVELWYEEQGRLASEHAGLDDNGDALFSLNPSVDIADGGLAEIAYIDSLVEDGENLSAEGLALKSRIQDLERSVIVLRGRKAEYLEEEYWQQMEDLLVNLARSTGHFNAEFKPAPSSLDSADESIESQSTLNP